MCSVIFRSLIKYPIFFVFNPIFFFFEVSLIYSLSLFRYTSTWFQIDYWRTRELDWIRINSESTRMCSDWPVRVGLPKRLFRAECAKTNFWKAIRISDSTEKARVNTRTICSGRCFEYTLKVRSTRLIS